MVAYSSLPTQGVTTQCGMNALRFWAVQHYLVDSSKLQHLDFPGRLGA